MPVTEALYVLKVRHDRPAWRVTLEELRGSQRWEFASLEACLNFIAGQHAETVALEEEQPTALSRDTETKA